MLKFFKKTKRKFFSSFSSSSSSNRKVYGFDSGLNQYLASNELQDFLVSEEPVWLLGKKYSTINELKELQDDFRSRIWITYRKNFASIGGSGPTSDQGWGCMIRVAQMTLAQALLLNYLGRDWRWIGCSKYFKDDDEENKIASIDFLDSTTTEEDENNERALQRNEAMSSQIRQRNEQECLDYARSNAEHEVYVKILKQFQDKKTSQYSIHQIALMGASEDKPVGTWFGPNTIAQTLRKLSSFDHTNFFAIHVAMDCIVIIDEISRFFLLVILNNR